MTPQESTALDTHLIIRVPKALKESLAEVAKSYGHRPTALARHLIAVNLPNITRNRFYDYSVWEMSSRELDILSRSLTGDYTVLRSDFLASDLLKDGQKWLKSVSDTARKEKQNFVILIAVAKN